MMQNSLIYENATSIAHCFDAARIEESPIFFWNSSGNGTCHLSKTLLNPKKINFTSFAQCKEEAEKEERQYFLWKSDGTGLCNLIGRIIILYQEQSKVLNRTPKILHNNEIIRVKAGFKSIYL